MRKTLKELELSIPTLDVLTCKQLMGGDGYYDDERINDIQEVVIIGERPDSLPDTERDETENPNDPQDKGWDDDLENDGSSNDNDSDNGQDDKEKDDIPKELEKTIGKLPENVQKFIKEGNVTIVYDPNFKNSHNGPASYNSENKTITTSNTDANVITRELIHAAQDAMGILDGNSRSAEEFQEKALGDIADYADMLKNGGHGFGATLDIDSEDKANEWRDFVINCFDDRDTFDREYFKENIMNWFQDFQDAHKDIDGYNDELESDYEWSWDDFFDFLGL